jgi:hypothetical protein
MLPSIEAAFNVNGPRRKAVASSCEVSRTQMYSWLTGRAKIPNHKRQSLDRAFGHDVDWVQYDLEMAAISRSERHCELVSPIPAPTPHEEPLAPPVAPKSSPKGWFASTFQTEDDEQ